MQYESSANRHRQHRQPMNQAYPVSRFPDGGIATHISVRRYSLLEDPLFEPRRSVGGHASTRKCRRAGRRAAPRATWPPLGPEVALHFRVQAALDAQRNCNCICSSARGGGVGGDCDCAGAARARVAVFTNTFVRESALARALDLRPHACVRECVCSTVEVSRLDSQQETQDHVRAWARGRSTTAPRRAAPRRAVCASAGTTAYVRARAAAMAAGPPPPPGFERATHGCHF
ncbi:Protein of unknown function [Gryllus bimaculatus]|nr:Protein of unknown function [Gryllus bimaculatus]